MEFNWGALGYRDIVDQYLGYRNQRRPRGAIKKLSEALRCHSTFIAQVLKEQADFSLEQGYEVCRHFSFSRDEQDFFLTLLMRDRSATKDLKQYFQSKIDRTLEAKRDLKENIQSEKADLGLHELEYFGHWLFQMIHALTQIPQFRSAESIGKKVDRSAEEISLILTKLEKMGLVKQNKSSWQSTLNSLHLAKSSPHIRSLHATWKTKILSDLHTKKLIEGTRYSGLITLTESDYQKVRNVLVEVLGKVRKIVDASNPEEACLLSIDCYKI